MSNDQEIQVEDLSNDKSYFTQIPNIIYRMGLGPYVIAYYCILKSIAGDKSTCFMSQSNLAKLVGCSSRHIIHMNKFMSQPFKVLGGKPLIRIKNQKKNGEYLPNIIQVVDIWVENINIIANKTPVSQTPMPKKDKEIKESFSSEPYSPPCEPYSPPYEPGSHKEETIEEDLYKKNDNIYNNSDNRSSFENDSIVSFDAKTYRLPDGKPLSLQMQRSIAKYPEKDLYKLRCNVAYFEEQVKKGIKLQPNSTYERWLQTCIKYDYAGKEDNAEQNKRYATYLKKEHNPKGLNLMKTVVQFKRSENEPPESISYSLNPIVFSDILEKYIEKK